MDVLAKARPVIDSFREQVPNLRAAFDNILAAVRVVWAKVTDTGLLNAFFSRITGFLAGAVSMAKSSVASIGSSASGEQSQDKSQIAAGEAAPLLSSVVEHPADSVAPYSVAPDSVAPYSVAPDSVASYSVAPDSVASYSVAPDSVAPDSVAPDSVAPDSVAPPPKV